MKYWIELERWSRMAAIEEVNFVNSDTLLNDLKSQNKCKAGVHSNTVTLFLLSHLCIPLGVLVSEGLVTSQTPLGNKQTPSSICLLTHEHLARVPNE